MKRKKRSPTAQTLLRARIVSLCPAIKGSLALVHKPCIRPGCAACARGDKHPAHLLAFSHQGRRRCMYVPVGLVPELRRALENGRKIERLLCETGPALIREYRENRTRPAARQPRSGPSKKVPKKKN